MPLNVSFKLFHFQAQGKDRLVYNWVCINIFHEQKGKLCGYLETLCSSGINHLWVANQPKNRAPTSHINMDVSKPTIWEPKKLCSSIVDVYNITVNVCLRNKKSNQRPQCHLSAMASKHEASCDSLHGRRAKVTVCVFVGGEDLKWHHPYHTKGSRWCNKTAPKIFSLNLWLARYLWRPTLKCPKRAAFKFNVFQITDTEIHTFSSLHSHAQFWKEHIINTKIHFWEGTDLFG